MIPEALYTDWLSKNLADFFTAIGFQTRYAAVSQPVEATLPFDRIYAFANRRAPVCVFALQFKAPKQQRDLRLQFAINGQQLQKLQQPGFRDWVFYAFPYFTNVGFQQNALHLTNFCRPHLLPPRLDSSDFRVQWDSPYFYIETEAGDKPRILEVDRDGKIIAEVPLKAQTKDHHLQTRMTRKLANGTTSCRNCSTASCVNTTRRGPWCGR